MAKHVKIVYWLILMAQKKRLDTLGAAQKNHSSLQFTVYEKNKNNHKNCIFFKEKK